MQSGGRTIEPPLASALLHHLQGEGAAAPKPPRTEETTRPERPPFREQRDDRFAPRADRERPDRERPGYAPLERRILLDRNLSLSLALTPEKPPPQEAAEEAPANKLVLKVEGRSWLRVTRDGERLYEGIPEVGSELVFDLPVEVRSGNPGAVRVILGGKDLGPMGEPGIPVTRRYP